MSQYESVGLPLLHAGKVRELYALPEPGRLLMVATDNISAFDHVLESRIPGKGTVLTQLSLWWFDQLADLVDHHVLSTDVPACVAGRAVVAERLEMIPVECVARGYLTGSGWAEYRDSGTVCGIPLPTGLTDGARLPEPIFTPAIKAPVGDHDENVSFERIADLHGVELAESLRRLTLEIYARAEKIACSRGIILADTKFEFGRRSDGTVVLADEVLTPDSSRFWDAERWHPGESSPSFDKQYVRDWLMQSSGWDRASDTPPPALPQDVINATRQRYIEAYERLTGHHFRYARPMATVVVNVMPKPEILDPQGKAVTGALSRMGFEGLTVRQGKRFEVTVEGEASEDVLAQIRDAAEKLLANTVIETFDVVVEG